MEYCTPEKERDFGTIFMRYLCPFPKCYYLPKKIDNVSLALYVTKGKMIKNNFPSLTGEKLFALFEA